MQTNANRSVAFLTAVFQLRSLLLCVFFLPRGNRAAHTYIYTYIYLSKRRSQMCLVQLCLHSKAPCMSSSLELHPGELDYSIGLQQHARWSNRDITGPYIRLNEIKRLFNNKNI